MNYTAEGSDPEGDDFEIAERALAIPSHTPLGSIKCAAQMTAESGSGSMPALAAPEIFFERARHATRAERSSFFASLLGLFDDLRD